MASNKKPSFLVYFDNEVIIEKLPDEDAGKLFKALFVYGREKTKPNFEDNLALTITFDILSKAIDRDEEKYYDRCQRNRENGKKGGRPPKNQMLNPETQKSEWFFDKPKKADKDMDKDMDKDKDKDMDMDMDKDMDMDNKCQQIADLFNATCLSFPQIKKITASRKEEILSRLEIFTIEDFKAVFELAETSDFLKGKKGTWKANFDWLIEEQNMIKVLEGNYNEPEKKEDDINGYYDDWGTAEEFYAQFKE